MFQTPILFLVFNRLDTTKQVFERIKEVHPKYLYIAADGARENKEGEDKKCQLVRDYVISNIDWECEVKTLFRENNLGCRVAVSSSIDWFFDNVEQGIILEDDVLPDLSFFDFCEKALNIYQNDDKVMHISGFNIAPHLSKENESHFFSYFGNVWGWATWRRAWKYYDVDLKNLEKDKKKVLKYFSQSLHKEKYDLYLKLAQNKIDTWDLQWTFARLSKNGVSIISKDNLVKNIGFGIDATHTYIAESWMLVPVSTMNKLSVQRRNISTDKNYDNFYTRIKKENKMIFYIKKILSKSRNYFSTLIISQIESVNKKIEQSVYSENSAIKQLSLVLSYKNMAQQKTDSLSFKDVGFREYSQHEEDGILLYIFSLIGTTNKKFVEMCAGNGLECNTTNLVINHRWTGAMFDGNEKNVKEGKAFFSQHKDSMYWTPTFVHSWINKENINQLIEKTGFIGDIDLFSLDIDGNDYWLLKELSIINPRVIVLEFNHLWGAEEAMTVPYDAEFVAEFTQYGSDYAGASLAAFVKICKEKGYRLVGTNQIATNAFFVRNDIVHDWLPEIEAKSCFEHPRAKFGIEQRFKNIKNKKWEKV